MVTSQTRSQHQEQEHDKSLAYEHLLINASITNHSIVLAATSIADLSYGAWHCVCATTIWSSKIHVSSDVSPIICHDYIIHKFYMIFMS